jgi:hypothetical protein
MKLICPTLIQTILKTRTKLDPISNTWLQIQPMKEVMILPLADSRLIGDRIYIPNILYNTDGTDHNEAALVEMITGEKIGFAGIEGVFGWAEVANRVRDELEKKEFECELRVLRPRTGKHARITTRASFIRNNIWFRKDWENFPQYAKFIRNLTSYLKDPGSREKE